MKTTGVVRRIDDLGRIVIPKEIRKTLRIKDGESLEIFLDSNNIILKKYSPFDNLIEFYQNYVDSVYSSIDKNILITDRDCVIAAAGDLKKEYLNNTISFELESIIQNRIIKYSKELIKFSIVKDKKDNISFAISPIIVNGDAVGSVIILSILEELDFLDDKITQIAAKFLGKYIE